jgi:hypothetical protein
MYTLLEDKSDQDSQSSEDYEALLSESSTQGRKATRRSSFWYLVILAPIVSIGLVGLGVWIGSRWLLNPNDVCPRHVQHYCKLPLSIQSFERQLKL